ncbi:MAG TPA: hypothetical protein PKC28_09950 [Bdellovibrionales bacterium]|nr:hypothetical protein [Bdellovibrionales bacterium]
MAQKPKNFSQAIDELERHVEDTMDKIRPHLDDLKGRVSDEAQKAKAGVEEKVQQNPWAAIGVVALLFFVIGLLLGRRSNR